MEDKKHEILEKKMCKELELLEAKYENNPGEMTIQDVDKIDKLYHALKCKATYDAMKEAEEYEGGFSGARGRSPVTGRYVSRDGGASYADGYSHGYSEAMSQMSGHYPMMYPPRENRW